MTDLKPNFISPLFKEKAMLAKKYSKDKKSCKVTFDLPAEVNAQTLRKSGLVSHLRLPIKVLGSGELTKKLTVTAAAFSKTG